MIKKTKLLEELVVATLEDYQAQEIVVLDIQSLTTLADAMIVCSGTSKRHTQTLASYLIIKAKAAGYLPLGTEGEKTGEWILIDLGDVIVHIMLPAMREFYSLEKLWASAESIRKKYSSSTG